VSARPTLTLKSLAGSFAVCRLPPEAPDPAWASGALVSVTRTAGEVSVVCEGGCVPEGVTRQGGFRCLAVAGPLDFAMTGVMAGIAGPLADAGVSLVPLGTYDTDYLLVRGEDLERAVVALRRAGHQVVV
jgi:hypothetical protein